ncbi:MAG: hypothetical protein LQ342_001563 [Letrouitia transgressa]|nr:MAG: hypothetical protein LQ342_001563 [Letrouitia transgressa]
MFEYASTSAPQLAAGLFALALVLLAVYSRIHDHLEIRRLGGHAPIVSSRLPFGIDLVLRSIRATKACKDLEFWEHLYAQCSPPLSGSKTVEFKIGGQRFIFTADPENIKAILASQFPDYARCHLFSPPFWDKPFVPEKGKGTAFYEDWKDFLGSSIFTTDGEAWHNSRNLIRPQFVKTRVSDLDIFEKHVQRLMSLVKANGQEFDISELFYQFTLDTTTDFLLGRSVDSLGHPDRPFAKAFAEVQRVQTMIARAGPFQRFISRRTFYEGLRVMNSFIEPFIQETLKSSPQELEEKHKSTSRVSFLDALGKFTRDRAVMRDQIVAVLLAGRDTTAGTLSLLFKELSANPDVYAKIRKEILDKVGPTRAPAYEDLKNMLYLQHAINETLRLYPAVPFNVRSSLKDTTLPKGGGPQGQSSIGVRKDTYVGYSPMYMQRNPEDSVMILLATALYNHIQALPRLQERFGIKRIRLLAM